MNALDALDDLMRQVSPEPNSGCWLWLAGLNSTGYASVNVDGRRHSAHKLIYQLMIGPVPRGLDLDHLCRVRSCVNPDHLEPVTRSENSRRGLTGNAAAIAQWLKTHCPQGHEYSTGNTYIRTTAGRKPYRSCRTCHRNQVNESNRRRAS